MITAKLNKFINNEGRVDYRHYEPHHVLWLLEQFGNPHRNLAAVHIAGTNGKGSIAHMLRSIFMSAGYTVGLYTSPHLLEINERITIQDSAIPDADLSRYLDEIIACADSDTSITPTYFDVLTVCAFRYFHDRNVDIAIIETGLGGRLDSTNVITPRCSVISDISLDHTHILGGTLPEIAREKAGIIKSEVPVVTSNSEPAVLKVLIDEAGLKNARLFVLARDFSAWNIRELDSGYEFDYSLTAGRRVQIPGIKLNLPLNKQVTNSCCAITAAVIVRNSYPALTDGAIKNGLARVTIPGRYQTLLERPLILYDPAHNVAAMTEVVKLVKKKYPSHEITLIITLMKDKDCGGILSLLEHNGMKALYYTLDDARGFAPAPGQFPLVITGVITADETELSNRLDRIAGRKSLFFFLGSFRLYSTAINYASHASINCS